MKHWMLVNGVGLLWIQKVVSTGYGCLLTLLVLLSDSKLFVERNESPQLVHSTASRALQNSSLQEEEKYEQLEASEIHKDRTEKVEPPQNGPTYGKLESPPSRYPRYPRQKLGLKKFEMSQASPSMTNPGNTKKQEEVILKLASATKNE